MNHTRRWVLCALAGCAVSAPAGAHTMFNQWVVFRQKHLLVGAHRGDAETFRLANDVVSVLDHLLAEARARVARAPRAERLGSLMATGQLNLAVLSRPDVTAMIEGAEPFGHIGPVPLGLIANLGSRVLVAPDSFDTRHAWLVASALETWGLAVPAGARDIPGHPGVEALAAGVPLEALDL